MLNQIDIFSYIGKNVGALYRVKRKTITTHVWKRIIVTMEQEQSATMELH
jgi:hypothetical protein